MEIKKSRPEFWGSHTHMDGETSDLPQPMDGGNVYTTSEALFEGVWMLLSENFPQVFFRNCKDFLQ